ncbi:MAG: isoprenylcysteine carboxylmethyltransferase family protein, partial [Gemmatimonadota bacterium]|nr:isoprenylcysteine carboxylmethyltransferase family protein [Gemmatimonadota bacterium]
AVPGGGGAWLVVVGGLIAGGAVWQFRDSDTTVDPRRPEAPSTMVTGGVYRWTRNPMYLAFALLLAGWACLLGGGRGLMLVPVFMLYLSRFQIRPEERALEELFEAEYREYADRVRRWI